MMKLTYGNCHRAILEALMSQGKTPDEAMAVWNATKLNRFEEAEDVESASCESGPQPMSVSQLPTPLEIERLRVREMGEALADQRILLQQREAAFNHVRTQQEDFYENALKGLRKRNDYLHNRRITLESALKTIRRLTSDSEIATVVRLALLGNEASD